MQTVFPEDKPLWEFQLYEDYTETTSMVFMKMHHSFTDGIGFVCLMSCLNDEQFKTKGPKIIKEPSFFQHIVLSIIMRRCSFIILG